MWDFISALGGILGIILTDYRTACSSFTLAKIFCVPTVSKRLKARPVQQHKQSVLQRALYDGLELACLFWGVTHLLACAFLGQFLYNILPLIVFELTAMG